MSEDDRLVAAYQASLDDYRRNWAVTDRCLRELCDRNPSHTNRAAVNAKLLVIGRAFATGIERKIASDGTQGNALGQIASFLTQHASVVDGLIEQIPAKSEQFSPSAALSVIEVHGRFTSLMRGLTRSGQAPRSFVSKYLHFHRPLVPIYDSFAAKTISRLAGRAPGGTGYKSREADPAFCDYVAKFERLMGRLRQVGERPTVRELDYFVICQAGHPWTGG